MQNWFGILMKLEDILLAILLFFPMILVLADSFFRALFLTISFFCKRNDNHALSAGLKTSRLLILVLANNEEKIIGETLNAILKSLGTNPLTDVAVLVDNCSDETAAISGSLGAKVYERSDNDPGKGKALSWFVSKAVDDLDSYDLVAILDADTIIPEDFFQHVQNAFSSEYVKVVQAFIEPKIAGGFPLTVLAGYSEILAQMVDDTARSCMGWSVPLKGKGMVFRTDIFKVICKGLKTQVDDIEISLRLAEKNIRIQYSHLLRVIDPNTDLMIGLARQRGRWLKGQRDIWKKSKLNLAKWLISGFSTLSLLQALLVKPKAAIFLVKALLGLIFIVWHPLTDNGIFFLTLILTSILVDILYYLIGLSYVENGKVYFFALLSAPLYFLLWLIGYLYSFTPGEKWLRARE